MTTTAPALHSQVRVSDDALRYLRAVLEADALPDGVVYFLERPDKWQDDYAAWIAAGRLDVWPEDQS